MGRHKKKQKNAGYRYVQCITCPQCKDRIWSRHRHDFRHCKCGYCFVDGGRDYLRYGWNGDLLPVSGKMRVKAEELEKLAGRRDSFPY